MAPKHRVGPEERQVRVSLCPHLGANELMLSRHTPVLEIELSSYHQFPFFCEEERKIFKSCNKIDFFFLNFQSRFLFQVYS